jgi:hypothetical protein
VQFLAGDHIERGCAPAPGVIFTPGLNSNSSFQIEGFKGQQEHRDVRKYVIIFTYCTGEDLCNGTGRLAEISTMMILLPAFSLLFISFFSKL